MPPKFSVIMPNYKTEDSLIERAIQSVIQQRENSWELIIVDDNGKDSEWVLRSKGLQKKYESKKIKFIFHDTNLGANVARNNGIKEAQGEFVAFLDADDEWGTEYLYYVSNYKKNRQSVFTSCNYRIVNEAGIQPPRYSLTNDISGNIFEKEIYGDIVSPTSAVTVKRSIILEAGLFDESLRARQDYDMWLRICQNYQVDYILNPLVSIYRDGHESISSNHKRHVEGTEAVLKKILNNASVKDELKPAIKSSHYVYLSITCLRYHDYDGAKKYAMLSLQSKKSMKAFLCYCVSYFPSIFEISRHLRKYILYRIK